MKKKFHCHTQALPTVALAGLALLGGGAWARGSSRPWLSWRDKFSSVTPGQTLRPAHLPLRGGLTANAEQVTPEANLLTLPHTEGERPPPHLLRPPPSALGHPAGRGLPSQPERGAWPPLLSCHFPSWAGPAEAPALFPRTAGGAVGSGLGFSVPARALPALQTWRPSKSQRRGPRSQGADVPRALECGEWGGQEAVPRVRRDCRDSERAPGRGTEGRNPGFEGHRQSSQAGTSMAAESLVPRGSGQGFSICLPL